MAYNLLIYKRGQGQGRRWEIKKTSSLDEKFSSECTTTIREVTKQALAQRGYNTLTISSPSHVSRNCHALLRDYDHQAVENGRKVRIDIKKMTEMFQGRVFFLACAQSSTYITKCNSIVFRALQCGQRQLKTHQNSNVDANRSMCFG